MHVTAKGQVTIPLEIRKKLGFLPDTEVEFALQRKGVLLRRSSKPSRRAERVVNRLRGSASIKMSTDEIMRLTRGE
jgi:AbrB family looped-hinge helix DNA binding protein